MKNVYWIIGAVVAAVIAFLVFSRSRSSGETEIDLGGPGGSSGSSSGGDTSWIDDLLKLAGLGGGEATTGGPGGTSAVVKYKAPTTTYYEDKPGELAMAAGIPVVRDLNQIQEGQSAVYIQEYEGLDPSGPVEAPVLVEKYKGIDIVSPIATYSPTPTTDAERDASSRSVHQLIDAVQAQGLNRDNPDDLAKIRKLDTEIRLANYAGAGVPWEDTHLDITKIGTITTNRLTNEKYYKPPEFAIKTAQRWLTDVAAFVKQGGIISPETKAKIQSVAAGQTIYFNK